MRDRNAIGIGLGIVVDLFVILFALVMLVRHKRE
jgi:hypothetical protein